MRFDDGFHRRSNGRFAPIAVVRECRILFAFLKTRSLLSDSSLRQTCFAHALGNPRTLRETDRYVRWRTGMEVGKREIGIDGEASPYRSPRLLDSPEMSQRRGKVEVNEGGDIRIGLDGPPEPVDGSFIGRKIRLRDTRRIHPTVCSVVAGRQPKCLHDIGFSLLGATEITFAKANPHVSGGQISIQLQRPLTFGNALSGAI